MLGLNVSQFRRIPARASIIVSSGIDIQQNIDVFLPQEDRNRTKLVLKLCGKPDPDTRLEGA